jgi:hypothetical protein
MIWFPLTEKMEEWYGGLFLGNWAFSGRKSSKYELSVGKTISGIARSKFQWRRGRLESFLGIYNI